MRLLAAVFENVYDLLVEYGSIAVGTLVALGLVAGWSAATSSVSRFSDLGGPLLFILLMGLLLGNLYRTGRIAARKVAADASRAA
jgi:hypothetical protein